ncbi:hypothetical protein MIZ01_0560 [Sideroxyarcus emersonii]|uniref:Hemerythrin-like domain-containing protein n=1 Tax=Sideroxyarcus emersonii TaxID=2764705 RepID=A0AAN1X8R7_9PROT|nr:hemerythrin domain-containing protein [Sideroxyarcus emersonii]BCK86794.1 hypothetical protein MIZ01_0560 [Sideroxyarcus emersonii]
MALHVQAIRNLAPEDYLLIEEEHLRLHRFLENLRSTCRNLNNQQNCQSCPREQLGTCRGRLASFFLNIIDISFNHFTHEESVMLRQGSVTEEHEDFRTHQQAHREILHALDTIISECASLDAQGKTAEAYRQLYRRLSEMFNEHDRLFDNPFIQSTKPLEQ